MSETSKGTILLTAAGFYNPKTADFVVNWAKSPREKRVVLVTTAAEGKENNAYSVLAKKQFEQMGFNDVDFLDIETEDSDTVPDYDIVYVCGGNTFKLLKYAKEKEFKQAVLKVLEKGGLYVGVSAGSLLTGPSIQIANEVTPDKNEVGMDDFSALNIVNLIIYPHYDPKHEEEIRNFETRNNVSVTRLTNSQAAVIYQGNIEIIE